MTYYCFLSLRFAFSVWIIFYILNINVQKATFNILCLSVCRLEIVQIDICLRSMYVCLLSLQGSLWKSGVGTRCRRPPDNTNSRTECIHRDKATGAQATAPLRPQIGI